MRQSPQVLLQDVRDTAKCGKRSCMSIRGMRGLVRRKVMCVVFGWQRTVLRRDLGSCRIQSACMRCYNRDGQAKNHMKKFVSAVLIGPEEEN